MKSVGVRVLKSKLSEYLRLVKSGETVLITEHENVIAEIKPSHRQQIHPQTPDEILALLAEKGAATLASENPGPNLRFLLDLPKLRGPASTEILEELRRDSK